MTRCAHIINQFKFGKDWFTERCPALVLYDGEYCPVHCQRPTKVKPPPRRRAQQLDLLPARLEH